MLDCLRWNASERMRRAARNDEPPVVMGAATMPSRARMLPNVPSQLAHTMLTTVGASKYWMSERAVCPSKAAITSGGQTCRHPSWKKK